MTFDADTHTYRDDNGKQYPSATEIIGEAWPIDKRWYKEGSSNWGTDVHEVTALIDKGLMSLDDLHGSEMYLSCHAWSTFLQRLGGELLLIEEPNINMEFGYGYTADRLVKMPNGVLMILDIKTGAPAKWHEAQLGAYRLGILENHKYNAAKGFTVHLKKEGGVAKPVEHDVFRGSTAFHGLMTWRKYRGMFK